MSDEKQAAWDQQLQADVPTCYANGVAVGISPYDLSMVFALNIGSQGKSQTRVIMSLEHAVVMVMVLRRALREHIKRTGITPTVPGEVMRDLQLDEEEPLW
jgi:hypothetical protein